ncbi:hypothetical protein DPMN_041577 [Dreissena polymorpha]|uniref:Uncharacterized protein n=1 Tax=Dreissena polymorpha TaxID=45954 RepID=A0A9D4HU13_DREPO|nr:hypothetical protein DPMN_041577 [Dreissena polymorpha]
MLMHSILLGTPPASSDTDENTLAGHDSHSGNKMKDSVKMSAGLIVVLSIGIFPTFALLVVLGKRLFDGWQRRHINKLDYLINRMYR